MVFKNNSQTHMTLLAVSVVISESGPPSIELRARTLRDEEERHRDYFAWPTNGYTKQEWLYSAHHYAYNQSHSLRVFKFHENGGKAIYL